MRFEPKAAARESPGALLGNLVCHPHQTMRLPSTLRMLGAGAAEQVQTLHSLSGLCAGRAKLAPVCVLGGGGRQVRQDGRACSVRSSYSSVPRCVTLSHSLSSLCLFISLHVCEL